MPRPRPFLSVRSHLEMIAQILALREKYGDCPLVNDGLNEIKVINSILLCKDDEKRAKGNRKDITL